MEKFAGEKGYDNITPEVMEEKYEFWRLGSKKITAELKWTEEAKIRVQKIPVFVRGMVIKEIENYAREKGIKEITSDVVGESKDKWASGGSFHSS